MEDVKVLLAKAMKYCAYQERCTSEVEKKLRDWGANSQQIIQIQKQLEVERFVDNSRFARIYARSKFNGNKWGRAKIRMMLQQKGIEREAIDEALEQLPNEDYLETIRALIAKKKVKAENEYQRKQKIAAWLHGKGFEPDLIWKALDMEEFD